MTEPKKEDGGHARPKMAPWKIVVFWSVLVVLVLGFLEITARIGLAAFRGFDGEHLYQYAFDPYKNIHPTPGFEDTRGVRHNSVGFRRDAEVPVEKPAGTYRVFLMGASTAYGLGGLWPHIDPNYPVLQNSETIDAYLETLLSDSVPGVRVEVINAAITSTWTHHSLIYLNQRILKYDPDLILFLDGFNDFFYFDPRHDQFGSYAYGQPARLIMGEPTLKGLIYANAWWLFRKSAAAHVASRGLRTITGLVRGRPEQPPMNVDEAMAGLQRTFPENALAMHERIGLILEGEGVDAVFMLQPMLITERDRPGMPPIERELFEFNVESYRPNYEEFVRRAVPYLRAEEEAMAARVGARFLDLTEIFDGVDRQIYTDYAHLTPLGNRLVAERIAREVLPTIRSRSAASPTPAAGPAVASPGADSAATN